MKKFKRLICAASMILIFLPYTVYGQTTQKRFSIKMDIAFNSQTEPTEIKLPILAIGNLNIIIEAQINQGELIIELYDPQGEKQGNFTIGSPSFSSKESVKGSISKKVINSNKAEWIVKFIPKNASGAIEIDCVQ
jgi:hypothetical protein